jgi:hypothetical protein
VDRDGLPGGACENRHQLVYREGCIMGPDGVQGFAQARDGILAAYSGASRPGIPTSCRPVIPI